jgi:two-component system, NtrC family, nitrogen regulation response regulator GlnG
MLDMPGDGAPRIMATSQSDLMRGWKAAAFRQDLFYRLGGVTIQVPGLRERVDDIPLLAEHFLAAGERDGTALRRLSPEARDLMRAYSWPGNVRQLENTLRRLMVTAGGTEIARPRSKPCWATSRRQNPCAAAGMAKSCRPRSRGT